MRPAPISFVETTIFTSRITRLGLEDDLRELQMELIEKPERGKLDPNTGGLRKNSTLRLDKIKGETRRRSRSLPLAA